MFYISFLNICLVLTYLYLQGDFLSRPWDRWIWVAVRHYIHFTEAFNITLLCGGVIDIVSEVWWSLRKRLVSCNRILIISCIVSARSRRKSWLIHFGTWAIDFDVLEIFSILFGSLINLYILPLLHILIITAVNRANEYEKYNDPKRDKAQDLPYSKLASVITWVIWSWCWIVGGNSWAFYWSYARS